MPKKRSPTTLKCHCLSTICSRIEYFALRHCQFDCLTIDTLEQIFNRLKTKSNLSWQHFQLVLTESINRIDLSSPYQNSGLNYIDFALDIIRIRTPNLIRIDLSNVLRIPEMFWLTIVPSLAHLKVINLRSTDCGDQEVLTIVKYCPHLRQLDLSLCQRVTNWSVSQLCQDTIQGGLEHLDVMQTQVDERGIRSVIQRCSPALKSLRWRNTVNVFAQIHRDETINCCPAIQQLISDSSYRLYSLHGAAKLCRNAVQVTIDGPAQLLATDLQALEHLNCLRELHVVLGRYTNPEFHPEFRPAFDSVLAKHGPHLRHLALGRVHNVDLQRIATHCRHLSSLLLELNHSYRSVRDDPHPPIRPEALFPALVKLSVLVRDREPNDVDQFIRDIPDNCLVELISSKEMRHLKITACQSIDDRILYNIGGGGDWEKLELESCANISMDGLWFVIGRSKSLSILKIYRCRLIKECDIVQLEQTIGQQQWDLSVDYYSDDP